MWWQEEIKKGLLYQELYGKPSEWRRFRSYYRHQWAPGTSMPLNMVFSIIRAMIPQVYFRNPKIYVTPTKPGMEMHAKTVEAVDNYLIQELNIKETMKRVIRDAGIQGSAVLWRGYDSEYGYDLSNLDPLTGDSTLTYLDKRGYRIEYNQYVNPGMPWAMRSDLESTVLPWGTRDVENAEWVALRVIRKLDDVKADPKYKGAKDLPPIRISRGNADNEMTRLFENDEYCELWEIHDVKTGTVKVVILDHPNFLRDDIDELQTGDLPFHWFTFNEDPIFPWGIPDARIIEPQQLEMNETRKMAMYHRRVAVMKMLYKKGAIKPEEVEKLLDEDVKAAIAVEADGGSIREVVEFVQSQVPQDLHQWVDICRNDIREITGFSRNQMGQTMGDRTTATEAKIVSGAHEIRVDERRDQAADFLTKVVRGLNKSVFKFWGGKRVVQVVGPSGLPGWIEYSGAEIEGEYNYRVDPNNGMPVSGETRKQDGAQLLQLWGGVSNGAPLPPELAKFVFSNYEGINVDALVQQMSMYTGQNVGDMPGGSPERPASMDQAAGGGRGVSPAFASAGAPITPPGPPQ
jgi:hypothetical protein